MSHFGELKKKRNFSRNLYELHVACQIFLVGIILQMVQNLAPSQRRPFKPPPKKIFFKDYFIFWSTKITFFLNFLICKKNYQINLSTKFFLILLIYMRCCDVIETWRRGPDPDPRYRHKAVFASLNGPNFYSIAQRAAQPDFQRVRRASQTQKYG